MSVLLVIAAALIVLFFQRLIWKRVWNRGLRVQVSFDQQAVTEGEQCRLTEVVTNRKILPLPALEIKFRVNRELCFLDSKNTSTTDLSYRSDVFCMLPYQRITRKMEVACKRRGYYTISKIDLVPANLLHPQLLSEGRSCRAELYVYPQRSALKGLEIPFNQMMGQCLTRRFLYEDPFEFRGIRDYVPADGMKRINWAATAKTGELKVNQYQDTSQQRVTLLLNLETEGTHVYRALQEESIRIVRSLTEWFCARGVPVRFLFNARDAESENPVQSMFGTGSAHALHCKRLLARIELGKGQQDFARMMRNFQFERSDFWVLISTSQNKQLQAAARQCGTGGGTPQWIVPLHPEMQRRLELPGVKQYYFEVEARI